MGELKLSKWDVLDHLKTREDMVLYFDACLEEDPGDGSLIRAALGDIARARGMAQLARDTGLARDSTDIPMDVTVTLRMSDQLRERGARKAREMGLSFGEYLRLLLSEDLDSPPGRPDVEKVIRKDDPASR